MYASSAAAATAATTAAATAAADTEQGRERRKGDLNVFGEQSWLSFSSNRLEGSQASAILPPLREKLTRRGRLLCCQAARPREGLCCNSPPLLHEGLEARLSPQRTGSCCCIPAASTAAAAAAAAAAAL
ncbi:hypothetical protein Emag_006649 [Eimeria magna]